MRTTISTMLWLLPVAAVLTMPFAGAPANDSAEQVEQKLQAIRKQIEDLRLQEQNLLKLQEQQRREAAEKATQYAKVEIRGRLHKRYSDSNFGGSTFWVVSFGDSELPLDIGEKTELRTAAEQLNDQTVLITGKLDGRQTRRAFGPETTVVVGTLKPVEK
jgi:hypothetical protein